MYKVVHDGKVIDIIEQPKFVRFLTSCHIAFTDKASAQGIVGSDGTTVYSFKQIPNKSYTIVSLDRISSDKELERYKNLLSSGQEISADEAALTQAKQTKIKSLSSQCNNLITSGFSIELSDGNKYTFKLTQEDQINLMLIENQLTAGESSFVYHATNQPCKIYSREDMVKIIRAFRKHVLYHTTYFNAAKQYINALSSVEKVNIFRYGQDISESVNDKVISKILKSGGTR